MPFFPTPRFVVTRSPHFFLADLLSLMQTGPLPDSDCHLCRVTKIPNFRDNEVLCEHTLFTLPTTPDGGDANTDIGDVYPGR